MILFFINVTDNDSIQPVCPALGFSATSVHAADVDTPHHKVFVLNAW